jgi:ribosomal protein S18 acetylase RimI-like enzyme
LFYLVPEVRGSGAGGALHEYAVAVSASAGVQRLHLNVSPTNRRALGYYRKHGWVDLGPHPGREEVHLMELVVERDGDL